ncbi:Kynureninase (L-kynurenine hydrolase) [Rhodosporidiobolus nylandii]
MGIYSLGAMLGPCIGPLTGGLISDRWSWNAIFFFLAAFCGVVFIIMLLFLPETLRSLVGDGSIRPSNPLNRPFVPVFRANIPSAVPSSSLAPRKARSINPFASLVMFREPDVALVLAWNSLLYSLFYMIITSTSSSLKNQYNLSESAIGLCYLANGGGMIAASALNGPRLNRDYRVVAQQYEAQKEQERGATGYEKEEEPVDVNELRDFPIERARLRSLPYSITLMVVSTIVYGWTVEKGVHISVPLICQFAGFASMTQFTSISTLLVDLFPGASASATASNNLARCLLGAGATAVIDPIISRMGVGWAFTMLSLLCVAFLPLLVIEWQYGMRFRQKRAERKEAHDAAEAMETKAAV